MKKVLTMRRMKRTRILTRKRKKKRTRRAMRKLTIEHQQNTLLQFANTQPYLRTLHLGSVMMNMK